jgi:chitin disaccharide deacetylase
VRRLIVNADDLGLTAGVNRAILKARRDGIVTSATLMANGSAFSDATQLVRSAPTLSVGCHTVLIDGSPVSDPSQVSTLLQPHSSQFHSSLIGFAGLALRGRLDPQQIETEAAAQIRRIQSAGITVSHLDTHKHTHMFPKVLAPLLRAAQTCGIPSIRNPFESVSLSHFLEQPSAWKRWMEVRALNRFAASFRSAVERAGLFTTHGIIGIMATGTLTQRWLRFMLQNLPEGTWELVCHPGYNDSQLHTVQTRLRESREEELRVLTSPETREILSQRGIELISYHALCTRTVARS